MAVRSLPSVQRGKRIPVVRQTGFPETGFPKSVRLLRSSDFRKVYDLGTRHSGPFFAAFILDFAAPGVGPRIGFTAPKALGKAVVRNRIKRRMREAVRLELASFRDELSPAWSIVFNPRRKVLDCVFTELQAEVKRLFTRMAGFQPGSASRSSSLPGTKN